MKGVAEVGKKLGEMWKALSDAEKEPFNKMAAGDKERYAKAMEDYKLTQGGEGTQETEREMDGTQEAEVKGEQ
jgi:structure-specific recognition protein 1